MTPADRKSIDANGIRFSYLEAGTGPLVLCVHGFPDTPHTFDFLLPQLAAAGFRAVSPFTRGYPPSTAPTDRDYSTLALGRDILALIAALGEERAVVVGHDWGALAAYLAANLEPARIEKMVTLAIPHPRVLRPNLRVLRGLSHFFLFQLPFIEWWVRRNDFAFIERLCRKWSPLWQPTAEDLAPVKRAFSEPGGLRSALGYYRSFVWGALGRSGREARKLLFRRTSVPTLTFAGGADGALGDEAFDASPSAFTNFYELVKVPRTGHFLHRENPTAIAEKILAFLKQDVRATRVEVQPGRVLQET